MHTKCSKAIVLGGALLILAMAVTAVRAQNPSTCDAVGATVLISEYLDVNANGTFEDGVDVSVTGQTKWIGEKLLFIVSLSQSGSKQCGYSDGTLTLTTPDGVSHLLADGAEIPLICGDASCEPAGLASKSFGPIAYTVRTNDFGRYPSCTGDKIRVFSDYINGISYCAGTCTAEGGNSVCSFVERPGLTCEKQCVYPAGANCFPYNGLISFRVIVRNTGNVTLNNIAVVDDKAGNLGPITTLAAGASWTNTGSYAPIEDKCKPQTDTIAVSATAPAQGTPVTTTCSATCNVCPPLPGIQIQKICGPASKDIADRNYEISGVVTNSGLVTLTNVVVVDHIKYADNTTADVTVITIPTLPAGVSVNIGPFPITPPAVCGTNVDYLTVTAKGPCDTTAEARSNDCKTEITSNPAIEVQKVCGPAEILFGESYNVSGRVINRGTAALTDVVVKDIVTDASGAKTTNIVYTVASLAAGATNTFGPIPITPTLCGPSKDKLSATGTDPCGKKPTDDSDECTTNVKCTPEISIDKTVACYLPTGCDEFKKEATGVKDSACPAFCWKIVVKNTSTNGVAVGALDVTDAHLPGVTAASFGPYPINPGDSRTNIQSAVEECNSVTNVVTATPYGWDPVAQTATANKGDPKTSSAKAFVKPISLTCSLALFSSLDMDAGARVLLPEGSVDEPVSVTLTLENTGEADLVVTNVTGLDMLVDCADDTTTLDIPTALQLPLSIAAGSSVTFTNFGCWLITCQPGGLTLTVTAGAYADPDDVPCVYDKNGDIIDVETTVPCTADVDCQAAPTCRTTGGGDLYDGDKNLDCVEVVTSLFPTNSASGNMVLKHVTHGGQLGAPFSHMDCAQLLADPCIRGQWQHNRHYQGKGNPRDVFDASFHSWTPKGMFDTLMCACLPCCPGEVDKTGPNGKFTGWAAKDICNKDDHRVCGPVPRPAPANALIFSGLSKLTSTVDGAPAKASEWVVFRVLIVDRSEPGGGHPGGSIDPADIYSFQAWRTGLIVDRKVDPNTAGLNSPKLGDLNTFRAAVSRDSCDWLAAVNMSGDAGTYMPGSLPSNTVMGKTADVWDKGALRNGNRQIHPATSAECTDVGGVPVPQ